MVRVLKPLFEFIVNAGLAFFHFLFNAFIGFTYVSEFSKDLLLELVEVAIVRISFVDDGFDLMTF